MTAYRYILAQAKTRAKQPALDQGGRVRQPPDPTKPCPNHACAREDGEVGSSRAANTPGTIDLFSCSTEEPPALRQQRIARTRSLPSPTGECIASRTR
jgi:hypothetical protein